MSDASVFILVFTGLFVLRIAAATIIFFYILPRGDRCPNCDSITVRLQTGFWNRFVPSLRLSWCTYCGWQGVMRRGPLSEEPSTADRPSGISG
jgi:hypothetical protein